MTQSRQKRTTSRQVAKHAGVSQTTVSLVLNNAPNANISQATRERVYAAARELGYIPNAAARSLARGRSSNIGLVLVKPHEQIFIDEYLPTLLTGLNRVAHQHGYRILVDILDDANKPNAFTHLVSGKEVAGLLVHFGSPTPAGIEELKAYVRGGFPVVTFGRLAPDIPSAFIDKLDGVRQAVEHLIRIGHTRIACIPYAPLNPNTDILRRLARVRETLATAGLTLDDSMIEAGAYDPKTGYDAMQRLLERQPWPTAVFAMNDVMAFGALEALRQRGIRVPQEMAVVGFDDIRLAAFASPPLTTIREPDLALGSHTAQLLIDQIEGHQPQEPAVRLVSQLIVRESCGAYLQQPPSVT